MKDSLQWKKTKNTALQITIRVILGLLFTASAIAAIYVGRKPYGEELKIGDVSLRTIYAPISFKYPLGIDEEKTRLEREKAAAAVDEVYDLDPEITRGVSAKTDNFFEQVIAAQHLKELGEEEKLQQIKSALEVESSDSDLKSFLAEPRLEDVKTKAQILLKKLLLRGIISSTLERRIIKTGREELILRKSGAAEERLPIDSFLTRNKVKKELTVQVQALLPENRKLRLALINLLERSLSANVHFNEELTIKRRQHAFDNAPIQYKQAKIKKEELIISRGERLTKKHLLEFKEMFRRQVKVNRFMFFSGATILTLIFLSIIAIYLKFYEPDIFLNIRKLTLVAGLFILILGLAKLITYSPLPSYAIPTVIASILLAILINSRLAFIITVALSIFVGIIAGDKLGVTTVSFVGGIVGIFFIRGARRRSQILIAGCLVGMANFSCICAIGLLQGFEHTVFFKEGFWGIVNGLTSAVIITGLLPVFEYLFNRVTNISLLELSDLNHPLLKEMVVKAPGTYHHSLIVGNLAEAACSAIGANALLARVGSYFHDIGKTEKAEYFSENQIGVAKKRHDKLTPSMSSLIITNHVKDGVELARKYRLNQAISDFIEQHHGTSLIYYFYQRALEKVEADQIPREEGFRYPGPKPQTRETAVVLLADSVEAASRALSEPTPARLKGLVRKIINNKFIDNQLDQCELTLKNLDIIADSFTRILMGIFHSRIEYENKNKRHPEKDNHK